VAFGAPQVSPEYVAVAQCTFCRAEEKLTGEHVFPNWLRTAVGDGGAQYFRRTPNGQVKHWATLAYSATVNDVCSTCNSGWMSRIEGAAAPVLLPMLIRGEAVTLDASALRAVSSWAMLRSLVVPLASGPNDVPSDLYRTIEQTHTITPNAAVWLGKLEGTDERTAFFLGTTLNITGTTHAQPDAFVATMAIGKLVTRIFVLTPGRGDLGAVSNGPFDAFLVPIWPDVNSAAWPPKTLDVKGYADLIRTLPLAHVASLPVDLK